MCGRYWVPIKQQGHELQLSMAQAQEPEASLIVPSLPAPVITSDGDAQMRFGMKRDFLSKLLINARCETLTDKATFSQHFAAGRRCLIPCSSFYEPSVQDKKGLLLSPAQGETLYMAGLYDTTPDMPQFIIITREADESIAPHHHRMPLLLQSEEFQQAWLRNDALARYILEARPQTELKSNVPGSG